MRTNCPNWGFHSEMQVRSNLWLLRFWSSGFKEIKSSPLFFNAKRLLTISSNKGFHQRPQNPRNIYTCNFIPSVPLVCKTNSSALLIHHLKYFLFMFRIRWDIWIFVHSAFCLYTLNFVPHILSIRTISLRLFSVYLNFHSAYSPYTLNFISCNLSIS